MGKDESRWVGGRSKKKWLSDNELRIILRTGNLMPFTFKRFETRGHNNKPAFVDEVSGRRSSSVSTESTCGCVEHPSMSLECLGGEGEEGGGSEQKKWLLEIRSCKAKYFNAQSYERYASLVSNERSQGCAQGSSRLTLSSG